jgi:hypothetical protein
MAAPAGATSRLTRALAGRPGKQESILARLDEATRNEARTPTRRPDRSIPRGDLAHPIDAEKTTGRSRSCQRASDLLEATNESIDLERDEAGPRLLQAAEVPRPEGDGGPAGGRIRDQLEFDSAD